MLFPYFVCLTRPLSTTHRNIRTVSAERLVRRALPKSPNPLAADEHVEAEEKGEKFAKTVDTN